MRSVVCWRGRESGIACWCRILLGESWRHDKTWRGTPILNPFRTHIIFFCTEKPRIQIHITDREYSEHFKAESGEKCTLYWRWLEQRISDKIILREKCDISHAQPESKWLDRDYNHSVESTHRKLITRFLKSPSKTMTFLWQLQVSSIPDLRRLDRAYSQTVQSDSEIFLYQLHEFSHAKSSFELVGLNRIVNKLYQVDKNRLVKERVWSSYSSYGGNALEECK